MTIAQYSDDSPVKLCSVDGCGWKHRAKGFCTKHYKAQWFRASYVPKQKRICGKCGAEHWGKKEVCPACDERAYVKSEARKETLKKHAQTETFKETQRRWAKAHPTKKQALVNSYRRHLRERTPKWANKRYIRLFYEIAQLETERTGRQVEVDHIYPIKGKYVCGLHVEHNLQLMFKSDNSRKGNRVAL